MKIRVTLLGTFRTKRGLATKPYRVFIVHQSFFIPMKRFSVLFLLIVLGFVACKEDDPCADSVTYSNQIKPIINATCAYAGCHDGDPNSSAPGNYNNLADITVVALNGKLNNRVVILKDMPPSNATGPKTLTDDQLQLVKCWVSQGYK